MRLESSLSHQHPEKTTGWKFRLLLIVTVVLVATLYHFGKQRTPVAPAKGEFINATVELTDTYSDWIRVATYNIRRGKNINGKRDLKHTANVIGKVDIIGLNEVRGPFLLDQRNQAEQLGQQLGMGWLFAPIQNEWFKHYLGNALLSRVKVNLWETQPLLTQYYAANNTANGKFRNLITAHTVINAKKVVILVTHLDRGAIKEYQIKTILAEFNRYNRVILIGDLNTGRNTPLLSELLNSRDATDCIHQALKDSDDKCRVDWIITRGFDIISGGSKPTGVSDHPYYWVDLKLK